MLDTIGAFGSGIGTNLLSDSLSKKLEAFKDKKANDTGFYIRYDKLLEFLKSSSYTLVWTSLCEKRILTPSFGKWDLPPKAIHMSSVYYLKDGKIAKASETLFEDRLYY